MQQQVQLLVAGFDGHEAISRRNILLIHGVTEDSNQELDTQISSILSSQLQLSNIDATNIDICHRLGIKKDKPRPILVRFSCLKHRNEVWRSRSNLKGSGVTISEFLTKPRQEIFVVARKHFGLKNCWTTDGTVIVLLPDKSRRKVFSMSELKTIMDKHPNVESFKDLKSSRSRRNIKNPAK